MKKQIEKDAYELLKEAREKYSEITLEPVQNLFSDTCSIHAKYKGIEYNMGAYSSDMKLPCENFIEAVEHFINKDDVFKKALNKIDNPPYSLSKRDSVEQILEIIIIKDKGKKEMDRIHDEVMGTL